MELEQLKVQLAEAVRAWDDSSALRIALDLIEQLEKTLELKDKEIRMLRAKTNFRPSYDTGSDKRLYQEYEPDSNVD